MPCAYCGGHGHNRRTCGYFNAEKYAVMIAEGFTKDIIYREIDCVVPGAGLAIQVVDVAYHAVLLESRYSRMGKNERYRKAFGIIDDGAGILND